jgi:hypothetical protein
MAQVQRPTTHAGPQMPCLEAMCAWRSVVQGGGLAGGNGMPPASAAGGVDMSAVLAAVQQQAAQGMPGRVGWGGVLAA